MLVHINTPFYHVVHSCCETVSSHRPRMLCSPSSKNTDTSTQQRCLYTSHWHFLLVPDAMCSVVKRSCRPCQT